MFPFPVWSNDSREWREKLSCRDRQQCRTAHAEWLRQRGAGETRNQKQTQRSVYSWYNKSQLLSLTEFEANISINRGCVLTSHLSLCFVELDSKLKVLSDDDKRVSEGDPDKEEREEDYDFSDDDDESEEEDDESEEEDDETEEED